MIPFGYLELSLTKFFHSILILNTSNSQYHPGFELLDYSEWFLGLRETFITNCFPCFGPLQARLCPTCMTIFAFQHQHHQFGSSPKSGSVFDNWANSFYSTQRPLSRMRRPNLLHWKQTYYCSSQGEMPPYCSWPSKTTFFTNCISHWIVTHSSFCSKTTELLTILSEELSQRQFFNLFPSPPCLVSSFCTN